MNRINNLNRFYHLTVSRLLTSTVAALFNIGLVLFFSKGVDVTSLLS